MRNPKSPASRRPGNEREKVRMAKRLTEMVMRTGDDGNQPCNIHGSRAGENRDRSDG